MEYDEWNDLRVLRARLAFVLTPSNGKPAVGVEEVQGNTHADLEHRTVLIDNIKILGVRFPSLSGADEAKMQDLLTTTFPGRPLTVSLDRLIAAVHAANADADVIKVEGTYFLCLNAVWLSSPAPTGPWTIVTEVPAAIYTIPPSSPVYHVTYVKIEGSNQDEVTCSYTAGDGGAYIAAGAAGADSGAKREGATDQTNRLDQEASARQRGSQNANLQQRSQQRGSDRFERSGGERTSSGAGRTRRRRD